MTAVAVLSILWPLSRPAKTPTAEPGDVAFYRDRLAQIARERDSGILAPDEAEAATADTARKILAAAEGEATRPSASAKKWAAGLALVAVPVIALGLYERIGRPDLPDLPLEARLKTLPGQQDFGAVIARMEAHLAAHPEDGRAQELMAPVYQRMGRYDEAVQARQKALEILGETPERLLKLAEAIAYANNGDIPPGAVALLQRAQKIDPQNAAARFYLGLAAAQNGDRETAKKIWTELLPELPDNSPARQEVTEKLALLDKAPDAPQEAAPAPGAAPQGDQQGMIVGMVNRLADRLAKQGGSLEEWERLIKAQTVLNAPDKAKAALADARKSFQNDAASLEKLDAFAKTLGLGPQ